MKMLAKVGRNLTGETDFMEMNAQDTLPDIMSFLKVSPIGWMQIKCGNLYLNLSF